MWNPYLDEKIFLCYWNQFGLSHGYTMYTWIHFFFFIGMKLWAFLEFSSIDFSSPWNELEEEMKRNTSNNTKYKYIASQSNIPDCDIRLFRVSLYHNNCILSGNNETKRKKLPCRNIRTLSRIPYARIGYETDENECVRLHLNSSGIVIILLGPSLCIYKYNKYCTYIFAEYEHKT